MEEVFSSLFLLWAAILMVGPVCGFWRALAAEKEGIFRFLVSCARAALSRAWCFLSGDASGFGGCADAAVQRRLERIHREQLHVRLEGLMRALTQYVHPVSAVVMFLYAMRFIDSGVDSPLVAGIPQSVLQLLPVFPASALISYFYVRRYEFSRYHFRFCFSCVFAREALLVLWPTGDTERDQTRLLALVLVQLWVAITAQDNRFLCPLHIGNAVLYIMAATLLPNKWSPPFCLAMVLFKVLVCFSLVVLEKEAKACIRAELETQMSQQHSAAAHNLLSSMCDAVVQLSDDYEVQAGYQKLAVLLLRQDVFEPASPCCFLDIIATESDKDAFKAFVERSCCDESDENFAHTSHITLRDSTSTCFPVQLFHAQAVSADKRCIHVIGICDSGDIMRQPQVLTPDSNDAASAVRPVGASKVAPLPKRSSLTSISESTPENVGGAGATAAWAGVLPEPDRGQSRNSFEISDSSGGTPRMRGDGPAMVWVDPSHLNMQCCTQAFADLFGAVTVQDGASFLCLILQDERMRFWQSFQDKVREMVSAEGEASNEQHTSIEVSVYTNSKGPARMRGSLAPSWRGVQSLKDDAWGLIMGPADSPAALPSRSPSCDEVSEEELPLVAITVRSMTRIRATGAARSLPQPARWWAATSQNSEVPSPPALLHL